MPTNDDPIRSATEAFAADITALIQRAALDAVRSALGAVPTAAPAKKAAPTPKAAPPKAAPAKKAPPAKAAPAHKAPAKAPEPKASGKKAAPVKRPPGAKRPPAELAALVEKLAGYIQANPGQGAEAIGKALNLPTSELTLPVKKLIAAKRVRFEGVKRATRYYPA